MAINAKRGKTQYIFIDVINSTKTDKILSKGTVIGSCHSVSAVMPMNFNRAVNQDNIKSEKDVLVNSVSDKQSESSKGKEK